MTMLLLTLAAVVAMNPFRVSGTRSDDHPSSTPWLAGAVTVGALAVLGALSGPFFDAIDLTGSSARIAAGVAIVAVAVKDMLSAPPGPQPGLSGWKAALVPVAFPTMLTPAVAGLAMAGAADRGVGVVVVAMAIAAGLAAIGHLTIPERIRRVGQAVVGMAAVVVGVLVVLDGVYAI